LARAAETGQTSDDRWHVRKDGTYFWALGITTAMRDDDGTLRGFAKVLRDSTDRKRFEEELRDRNRALEEADRRKNEFLALLAHELRNPLAPIYSALTILGRPNLPADLDREARAIIDRQVRGLALLVDDLLDVSRITAGKVELRRKSIDLCVVADNAIRACQPLIAARRLKLDVSLPDRAVWLDADPTRIEQVLTNLLNNAAKYTDEGGQIAVTIAYEAHHAVVRVSDTGIGITADLLPTIFDLFAQGDHSLDHAQGGLGVGLTIVRKLVEMHGGYVHAASAGPGKGSEFVVSLPTLEVPAPQLDAVGPAEPGRSATRRLHVLVVDDNVDAAETLAVVLGLSGHTTKTAHSGLEALDEAQRLKPDVILLDIGLPLVNGYDVAKRLNEIPSLKDVPLIALSGYGHEEARQRSAQAGFAHHLVKPVDPAKLEQLLDALQRGPGSE
jgi:signal transduction histidine kinase/ActR/RegA family two-component response regulator